ncbi:MAG: DNA-directed RNA polymerase subunit omega [Candidatus Omnitrophica bacterium]|nr:DNA-directed RNA polymerase subunit omega [Candidatus Omnitrophota bacterium]
MKRMHIPVEELLPAGNGSIYKLTILVAKRAQTLADGERPLIDKPGEKALNNSLREVAAGRIRVKRKK